MAKVEFEKESGIKSVSGTVGGLTYRTINGKVFVHEARRPLLRAGASKSEKMKYRRAVIIDACVQLLQDEMEDWLAAVEQRPKIRSRVKSLYERYAPEISAYTKLQGKIMSEYRARFCDK